MSKLASSPRGVNDRLMTHQLPLDLEKIVTIISAYVPTMPHLDTVNDKFYEELDVSSFHRSQSQRNLNGDFHARVGTDH